MKDERELENMRDALRSALDAPAPMDLTTLLYGVLQSYYEVKEWELEQEWDYDLSGILKGDDEITDEDVAEWDRDCDKWLAGEVEFKSMEQVHEEMEAWWKHLE